MNKKIVCIVVSVCAASSSIGMNHQVMGSNGRRIFCLLPVTESGKQAMQIAKLLCNNDAMLTIQTTGNWLTEKRRTFDDARWISFVNTFVSDIEKIIPISGSSIEQKKLLTIKNIIKETASTLQPNQDCTSLLLIRILHILDMPSKY